jgi:hypothetical protein
MTATDARWRYQPEDGEAPGLTIPPTALARADELIQ